MRYYGLFAEFYENSSDEKPCYKVMMGCQKILDGELVKIMGFYEDSELHNGFTAFIKDNVAQQDLEFMTKPEFEKEMINVLFDEEFERIRIIALAYGKSKRDIPKITAGLGVTRIVFTHSDPVAPVIFLDETSKKKNGHYTAFKVPLMKLKEFFKVKTLDEVCTKLNEIGKEKKWSFDELKAMFRDSYPPNFYYRLSEHEKMVFKYSKRPHSERFIKLMNQEKPSKDARGGLFYNDEEIEFLAKEHLALFADLHELEAEYYMMND